MPRANGLLDNSTLDEPDTTLLGDSITEDVRMAETANLTMAYKLVMELTELLPVILSRHPSNMRITIHSGSFDILRSKNCL